MLFRIFHFSHFSEPLRGVGWGDEGDHYQFFVFFACPNPNFHVSDYKNISVFTFFAFFLASQGVGCRETRGIITSFSHFSHAPTHFFRILTIKTYFFAFIALFALFLAS